MTAADRKQQQQAIKFWRESAERAWHDAKAIFDSGRYHWSLFIVHLAIEKILKALVIQNEQTPPFTHELARLWRLTGHDIPKEFSGWLAEIDSFNIAGRYDDEKQTFYRKATKAYATEWMTRAYKIFLWLNDQFS